MNSINQSELNRARAQYRAGLIMSAESAASRASQIARQLLLFGRPIDKEELMTRLDALTVERLTDLSARLFSTRPTVAAIGPIGTLAAYERIADLLPGSASRAAKTRCLINVLHRDARPAVLPPRPAGSQWRADQTADADSCRLPAMG